MAAAVPIICFVTDEDKHQKQNSNNNDENIVKQDHAVSNTLYISPYQHDYSKSSITFCSYNKKRGRTEFNSRQLPSQMSGGVSKLAGVSGWQMLYKNGDLFTCPGTHALAHCISTDCYMGAGIAIIFKKKFGRVAELLAQKKQPGECAVLRTSERVVYYLITKNKYYHRPTYTNLRRSLVAMREHCTTHDVNHVSMPRIGCGLDKLHWVNVSTIINEVFKNTKVNITVYTL